MFCLSIVTWSEFLCYAGVDYCLWCTSSQGHVWSNLVVCFNPAFCWYFCLIHITKYLTIEKFIPHTCIEAFHISVLPWTAWLNEHSHNTCFLEPLLYLIGCKFWSIVTPQVFGYAIQYECIGLGSGLSLMQLPSSVIIDFFLVLFLGTFNPSSLHIRSILLWLTRGRYVSDLSRIALKHHKLCDIPIACDLLRDRLSAA